MKRIIKNILGLLLIGIVVIPSLNVKAASAVVDIYASNKNPVVGSSITVTVYVKSSAALGAYKYDLVYNSSKLKLTSGEVANAGYASNNSTKSLSKKFTFKVIATGSSSISAKNIDVTGFDEQRMSSSVSGTTVNGYVKVNTPVVYSTNNNLSKLSINGYNLSPAFNKNTTEYKVSLDSNVESITINATKEDSTASVSGAGVQKVSEGENKINVIVTSQKGTKKTYTIIATVIDNNPIKVMINNKEYTIIKRASLLEKPNNYEETTLKINDFDIPAFKNSITNYTLVGLKDTEGKNYLAIYNEENNTYSLYQEIKFNNLTLNILSEKISVPSDYKETEIEIGNHKVKAYKYNKDSKYALIYALNTETGKKHIYMFEQNENTVQIYNDEEVKILKDQINYANKLIYALAGGIVILSILLIIGLSKSKYKKTSKKSEDIIIKNTTKDSNDKEKSILPDETIIEDKDIDKEEENDKKDKKKKKKSHDIFDEW